MSLSKTYIDIKNLSIELYDLKSNSISIKNLLLNRSLNFKKKLIFKKINLEVKSGDIVGIIGNNGAGKTTLLSSIAGLIKPRTGHVQVNGRVLPLLGLGNIFHKDLDIIGNIELWNTFFNSNFNVNEAFIKKIILNSGINKSEKTYIRSLSNGMISRLAFALAMEESADVLLLDEVFAVGDALFKSQSREKLLNKMNGVGCSVIVSHDESLLNSICTKVFMLDPQHGLLPYKELN